MSWSQPPAQPYPQPQYPPPPKRSNRGLFIGLGIGLGVVVLLGIIVAVALIFAGKAAVDWLAGPDPVKVSEKQTQAYTQARQAIKQADQETVSLIYIDSERDINDVEIDGPSYYVDNGRLMTYDEAGEAVGQIDPSLFGAADISLLNEQLADRMESGYELTGELSLYEYNCQTYLAAWAWDITEEQRVGDECTYMLVQARLPVGGTKAVLSPPYRGDPTTCFFD